MTTKVFDFLIKYRWVSFWALLIVTGALVPFAMRAAVPDNALTVWFLETDPQLALYREFQDSFGNDEVVFIEIERQDGVFTSDSLQALSELTQRLEKIDGVDRVISVLNLQDAFDRDGSLEFDQVVPTPIPTDQATLRAIAEQVTQSEVFRDRVIDSGGKRTLIWVQMEVMEKLDEERDRIVGSIRSACAEVLGQTPHYLAGVGVIYSALNLATQSDLGVFMSVGYLVMFAVLWWVFRSFRLLLAAMGVILVANLGALGVYGLTGHRINMVTVALPSLLIILGLSDAIHFPASFVHARQMNPGGSRADILRQALVLAFVPCLVTTLTNMIGFLSLASSPMAVIRELGIFSAVGLAFAFVAAVVFMTPAMYGLPRHAKLPEHPIVSFIVNRSRNLVEHRPVAVGIAMTALAVVFGAGIFLIVNDTYTLGFLPKDHQVNRDHRAIVQGWGEYTALDFVVKPAPGRKTDDPELLNAIDQVVMQAVKLPEIRSGFSLADVYRRMATVLETGKPTGEPWQKDEVAQLGELLKFQSFVWDKKAPKYGDNLLAPFTLEDRTTGRFILVGRMPSARELGVTLDKIHAISEAAMAGLGTIQPAGYLPLYVKIIDYVMSSQIRSFFIAVGMIFLVMLLWLRSLRLALISLPSNIFPVVVLLGSMGYLGIHLDIATAVVAAVVVGVAVDDTIHLLHHWKHEELAGKSYTECLAHTYRVAAKPAVVTGIILIFGYPVLMLAEVKTMFYFGLLTTIAAVSALLGELFVTPLLLRIWPPQAATKGARS